MARSSSISLDQADHAVFGAATQITDWLTGVAYFVPLAFLDLDRANLARFLAMRMSKCKTEAIRSFELASSAATELPGELFAEVEKLKAGMGCFELAEGISTAGKRKGQTDSNSNLYAALWDSLEDEAKLTEAAIKVFLKEIDNDFKDEDALWAVHMASVEPLIRDAVIDSPVERARLLREARKALKEVISQTGDKLSFASWALYGWLSWQLDEDLAATKEIFATALKRELKAPGIGQALCARFYAYFLAQSKQFSDAYQWACMAAKLWPCADCYAERARYAGQAVPVDQAKREIGAYLKSGAVTAALAWADPALTVHGTELLTLTAKEQIRIRKMIYFELSEWKKVSKKAKDAANLSSDIALPHDLIDGCDTSEARVPASNFLTGSQLLATVTESKEDLKCLALAAFQNEKRKRTEMLQQARLNIEAAICGRDQWLDSSRQEYDHAVESLRDSLGLTEDAGDVVQKGCSRGMFGGCSIFGAYALMAVILAARGMKVGPTTPFGMFCLALASLPILGAIAFLVGYSSKRMVAESRASKEIASKRNDFENTRVQANNQFRSMIEAAQADAASQEKRLLLAEKALAAYQS